MNLRLAKVSVLKWTLQKQRVRPWSKMECKIWHIRKANATAKFMLSKDSRIHQTSHPFKSDNYSSHFSHFDSPVCWRVKAPSLDHLLSKPLQMRALRTATVLFCEWVVLVFLAVMSWNKWMLQDLPWQLTRVAICTVAFGWPMPQQENMYPAVTERMKHWWCKDESKITMSLCGLPRVYMAICLFVAGSWTIHSQVHHDLQLRCCWGDEYWSRLSDEATWWATMDSWSEVACSAQSLKGFGGLKRAKLLQLFVALSICELSGWSMCGSRMHGTWAISRYQVTWPSV